MSDLPDTSSAKRLAEWIAALIGAVNCILVPFGFAQAGNRDFPLPALYFIEIALLGVLVLAFVALRPRLGRRWNALPWAAAGIILAFVILGGFSIGFYMVPALIAFIAVGALANAQSGGFAVNHVGLFLVAAVAQAALMLLLVLLA